MNRPFTTLSLAAMLLGGTALLAQAQQPPAERPVPQAPAAPQHAAPPPAAHTPATPAPAVRPATPHGGSAQAPETRVHPGTPPAGIAQGRPETPPAVRGTPATPRGTAEAPEAKPHPATPPRGTAEAPPRHRPATPPGSTAETRDTPDVKGRPAAPRGTAEAPAKPQRPGAPPAETADTPDARPARPGVAGTGRLTPEQRTVLRERISERRDGPRLGAEFDVNIGARVPSRVTPRPLPAEIARTVPAYRGYSYVRRGDDIVIVEPRSRQIVAVIGDSDDGDRLGPAVPGERDRPGMRPGHFEVTPQQRITFRDRIIERRRAPVSATFDLSIGRRVPAGFALEPVPVEIVETIPAYRGYSYFETSDQIVIVEPETHEIVDVVAISGGGRPVRAAGSFVLSGDQKAFVIRHLRGAAEDDVGGIVFDIGTILPQAVQPHVFPDVILAEIPELRDYRYVVVDDDVVVIDPRRRNVVMLVDVDR